MSCAITSSRDRLCKTSIGGVKSVYIFPYVKYNRSLIVRSGMTITSFPETEIFEFEVLSDTSLEQKQNNEDGLKSYTQSIEIKLSQKQNLYGLENLLKKDLRIIIEDNNSNLRMMGVYNGVICDSMDYSTGSGKNDLNGATFKFEADEREEALYLSSLDVLSGSNNYIFMDGNNYIFMDGNNYIFN